MTFVYNEPATSVTQNAFLPIIVDDLFKTKPTEANTARKENNFIALSPHHVQEEEEALLSSKIIKSNVDTGCLINSIKVEMQQPSKKPIIDSIISQEKQVEEQKQTFYKSSSKRNVNTDEYKKQKKKIRNCTVVSPDTTLHNNPLKDTALSHSSFKPSSSFTCSSAVPSRQDSNRSPSLKPSKLRFEITTLKNNQRSASYSNSYITPIAETTTESNPNANGTRKFLLSPSRTSSQVRPHSLHVKSPHQQQQEQQQPQHGILNGNSKFEYFQKTGSLSAQRLKHSNNRAVCSFIKNDEENHNKEQNNEKQRKHNLLDIPDKPKLLSLATTYQQHQLQNSFLIPKKRRRSFILYSIANTSFNENNNNDKFLDPSTNKNHDSRITVTDYDTNQIKPYISSRFNTTIALDPFQSHAKHILRHASHEVSLSPQLKNEKQSQKRAVSFSLLSSSASDNLGDDKKNKKHNSNFNPLINLSKEKDVCPMTQQSTTTTMIKSAFSDYDKNGILMKINPVDSKKKTLLNQDNKNNNHFVLKNNRSNEDDTSFNNNNDQLTTTTTTHLNQNNKFSTDDIKKKYIFNRIPTYFFQPPPPLPLYKSKTIPPPLTNIINNKPFELRHTNPNYLDLHCIRTTTELKNNPSCYPTAAAAAIVFHSPYLTSSSSNEPKAHDLNEKIDLMKPLTMNESFLSPKPIVECRNNDDKRTIENPMVVSNNNTTSYKNLESPYKKPLLSPLSPTITACSLPASNHTILNLTSAIPHESLNKSCAKTTNGVDSKKYSWSNTIIDKNPLFQSNREPLSNEKRQKSSFQLQNCMSNTIDNRPFVYFSNKNHLSSTPKHWNKDKTPLYIASTTEEKNSIPTTTKNDANLLSSSKMEEQQQDDTSKEYLMTTDKCNQTAPSLLLKTEIIKESETLLTLDREKKIKDNDDNINNRMVLLEDTNNKNIVDQTTNEEKKEETGRLTIHSNKNTSCIKKQTKIGEGLFEVPLNDPTVSTTSRTIKQTKSDLLPKLNSMNENSMNDTLDKSLFFPEQRKNPLNTIFEHRKLSTSVTPFFNPDKANIASPKALASRNINKPSSSSITTLNSALPIKTSVKRQPFKISKEQKKHRPSPMNNNNNNNNKSHLSSISFTRTSPLLLSTTKKNTVSQSKHDDVITTTSPATIESSNNNNNLKNSNKTLKKSNTCRNRQILLFNKTTTKSESQHRRRCQSSDGPTRATTAVTSLFSNLVHYNLQTRNSSNTTTFLDNKSERNALKKCDIKQTNTTNDVSYSSTTTLLATSSYFSSDEIPIGTKFSSFIQNNPAYPNQKLQNKNNAPSMEYPTEQIVACYPDANTKENLKKLSTMLGLVSLKGVKTTIQRPQNKAMVVNTITCSPNQDRAFVQPISDNLIAFGVFDGHGEHGHEVAQFVSDTFHNILAAELGAQNSHLNGPLQSEEDLFKWIRNLFRKTDKRLTKRHLKCLDLRHSGTTASLVIRYNNAVYVSYVGDSKAVAYTFKGTTPINVTETPEHSPMSELEYRRIQNHGGHVTEMYFHHLTRSVSRIVEAGISVSRSFGDFNARTFGLISDPEIVKFEIEPQPETFDKTYYPMILVVATDGLWDTLPPGDVLRYFSNEKYNKNKLISTLQEMALNAWRQRLGSEGRSDDTTAILALIV